MVGRSVGWELAKMPVTSTVFNLDGWIFLEVHGNVSEWWKREQWKRQQWQQEWQQQQRH